MVSHTLSSVASLCDRAAWVENKKIRMIGPVGDVIKEYEAANAPKVQVPDTATFYPGACGSGVEDLDCSSAPAEFFPKANGQFQDAQVRISFLSQDGTHSLGHWSIAPQPVSLRMEGEKPLLENSAGESFPFILEAEDTAVDMHRPLMLMLQAQSPDGALGTPCWLPLCTTAEARQNYLQEKQKKVSCRCGERFSSPPLAWRQDRSDSIQKYHGQRRSGQFCCGNGSDPDSLWHPRSLVRLCIMRRAGRNSFFHRRFGARHGAR